jgi:hypothetical protein
MRTAEGRRQDFASELGFDNSMLGLSSTSVRGLGCFRFFSMRSSKSYFSRDQRAGRHWLDAPVAHGTYLNSDLLLCSSSRAPPRRRPDYGIFLSGCLPFHHLLNSSVIGRLTVFPVWGSFPLISLGLSGLGFICLYGLSVPSGFAVLLRSPF